MDRSRRDPIRRRAVVFVALALLLPIAVPLMAVAAEPDYGARPARLGGADRPGEYFAHGIETGESVVDSLEIFNFSDDVTTFDIYATDMVPTTGGGLTAASRAAPVTGPGSWITPETGTVEVAAHSSRIVDYTIDVPEGTAPGDYLAAVLVEPQTETDGGNIVTKTRIGLRVEMEVLGQIDLGVTLGELEFDRERDGVRFHVAVVNTGNVSFAAEGSVVVSDADGEEVSTVGMDPSGVFVAPGQQALLQGVWEDPPLLGRYQAQALIEAVVGERRPVQFTSRVVTVWLVPWAEILTILAIVALLSWMLFATRDNWQRWRRHRGEERALLRDFRKRRRIQERSSGPGRHRTTVG